MKYFIIKKINSSSLKNKNKKLNKRTVNKETINNNLVNKKINIISFNKKNLKKKIILKKKYFKKSKYFLKKKRKKLNIFYRMYNLEFYSIYYKIKYIMKILFIKRKNLRKKKFFFNFMNIKIKKNKAVCDAIYKNFKAKNLNKNLLKKKRKPKFILKFYIRKNNIFANLIKYQKKEFINIKFWSTGLFGFVCSKKLLKFVIKNFLKEIKKQLKKLKLYMVQILGPKYFSKFLFKTLKRTFYKPKYILLRSFKVFNGCRCKKARRKKHLKFQIFK